MKTTTTDTPTTRPLAKRISGWPYSFRNTEMPFIHNTDHRWIVQTANGAMDVVGPPCMTETGSNAELFCEALDVTCSTGRTPRQLATERAELIAALRALLFDSPNDGGMVTSDNIADARELLTRLQS